MARCKAMYAAALTKNNTEVAPSAQVMSASSAKVMSASSVQVMSASSAQVMSSSSAQVISDCRHLMAILDRVKKFHQSTGTL